MQRRRILLRPIVRDKPRFSSQRPRFAYGTLSAIRIFRQLFAGKNGDICHPRRPDSVQDRLYEIVTDTGVDS